MLTSEISAKLTALSLTTGYSVQRNHMPSSPDKVIALTETGGTEPEFFMGSYPVHQPALQVRVRGVAEDSDGPRATIEAIYRAICALGAFTISGVRYLDLTPLQAPFLLNRDGNKRIEFAVNFLIQKEGS